MKKIATILIILALLHMGSYSYGKSQKIEPIVLTVDYSEDYGSLYSAVLNNLQEENRVASIEIKGRQFLLEYYQPMFGYVPSPDVDNYANYTYHAIRNIQFQIREEDEAFMKLLKNGDAVTVYFYTGPSKTVPLKVFEREKRDWLGMTQGGGNSDSTSLTVKIYNPFILEKIMLDDETMNVERLTIGGKTVPYPLTEPITLQKDQSIHFVMSGGVSFHNNTLIPIWFSGKDAQGIAVEEKVYGRTFTPPPEDMIDQWVKEAKND